MTTILLIDLSSVAHPIWHTSQGSTNPNECSIQTVAKVRALASGQPHVAVCCDSGRSFRRELDPTYKAQRPEADATLMHQIALAVETLKADGFPCWAVKGMEADDIIATATTMFKGQEMDGTFIIASSDKDLLQLVSPKVVVKKLTDGSEMDEGRVYLNFGVNPNQMRDYLSLVGDSSDNIKGAEGIGPKKAAAMLTKYGTLEDLYAALDKDPSQFQNGTVKSLTEFRPRMDTVRALVTLRTDVPLPFDEVFKPRVPADVAVFGDELMSEVAATVASSPDEAIEREQVLSKQPSLPMSQGGAVYQNGVPAPKEPERNTQAMTVRELDVLPVNGDVRWQLEPRSMPEAIDLAKHMHASRLFSAYGTPQAVLSTIMAGREIGLQAQKALRAFHIIDGKPAESADLIRAQCLQSPLCEYFRIVERTAEKATWATKRKGDPEVSLTYTITEGRQAWQKDEKAWLASSWGKRPANMVTKTAAAMLARLVFPDVVLGMYCPEELTGHEVE